MHLKMQLLVEGMIVLRHSMCRHLLSMLFYEQEFLAVASKSLIGLQGYNHVTYKYVVENMCKFPNLKLYCMGFLTATVTSTMQPIVNHA